MKILIKILAVWGCIATLPLLYMLFVYLDREGIVEFQRQGAKYYSLSPLQKTNLPRWDLTNTIPLSPEAAVQASVRFASAKHPDVTNWDIDRISLEKVGDGGIWCYEMGLIDRKSGRYVTEYPRVLMDGNIWTPHTKE